MLKYTIALLLLTGFSALAQKPAEVGIISDNDLYTSPINDQYYTNGVEFFYRYLSDNKSDRVAKKITEFRVGQYMYTPQSPHAAEINVQDRPFAGYLFGHAGITNIYQNESVLKLGIQLGVVGPESGAEAAQKLLHDALGYKRVDGWKYQITTTPAAQLQAMYSHKIFGGRFHEKVDFQLMGEANVGTIWRSAAARAMARISLKGNLKPMHESSLYNAALNTDRSYEGRREWLLFLNPMVQYMNFDATIEGSPFNDKSPVTWPLLPFRFNAQAGVKYGRNNWNYGFSFNYRGKELSNNVVTGFYYGSVKVGYML